MKIKVTDKPYAEVCRIQSPAHKRPAAQSRFFRWVLKIAGAPELKDVRFTCRRIGMERLAPDEPCLVLMNHSCFLDLKIAATLLSDRPYHIVCTSDGFVGKEGLMRRLGCIPTQKFLTDTLLVRDMRYALKTLKSSILMYPEASYSFDGTATPLPQSLGRCLQFLDVPVVMIKTYGAFLHDPLYNNLRLRRVDVSADMEYLFSPAMLRERSAEELNALLQERFTFDAFRYQQENKICIDEPFRADDLNRVLYKCPHCLTEGQMQGRGDTIRCQSCGKAYRLSEYGALEALSGEAKFTHIPDWFRWEREMVRNELIAGTYRMETAVDICMMVDMKSIYRVGSGTLTHSFAGFHLTGCDGALDYRQSPAASYSLYSDYYWYEIGDMICIGTNSTLYYCFPKEGGDVVAKARLAAEELYKLTVRA
ncbi:MAG: 1-acyl-sn-glycerol-3-phosphate acyltransferase [Eubacteriales bacterium]|nr:1-acyl-sn-glycerol-3-phosphate acyltransferase [Eubacteriales bacterium]